LTLSGSISELKRHTDAFRLRQHEGSHLDTS
jgi:hypothetical protein